MDIVYAFLVLAAVFGVLLLLITVGHRLREPKHRAAWVAERATKRCCIGAPTDKKMANTLLMENMAAESFASIA